MSLWLKWKDQFIEAEKPNMVAIKTRLLDQIQGDIFQAECNELAKKLNKLIHDVSFEGMSQELLNKIVEASNINLDSLGNIDFISKEYILNELENNPFAKILILKENMTVNKKPILL